MFLVEEVGKGLEAGGEDVCEIIFRASLDLRHRYASCACIDGISNTGQDKVSDVSYASRVIVAYKYEPIYPFRLLAHPLQRPAHILPIEIVIVEIEGRGRGRRRHDHTGGWWRWAVFDRSWRRWNVVCNGGGRLKGVQSRYRLIKKEVVDEQNVNQETRDQEISVFPPLDAPDSGNHLFSLHHGRQRRRRCRVVYDIRGENGIEGRR